MTNLLQELNPAQKKAVEALFGPVLVLAGPGTGKTHLLTTRIAHILQQTDAKAENILCLTFTNAAAVEMKERLFQKIGKEALKVTICTFHSFVEHIMNEYPLRFEKQKAGREIADDLMKALAYRDAIQTKHWKHFRPVYDELMFQKDVLGAISNMKREHLSPAELRELIPKERKLWEADENNYYKTNRDGHKPGDEKPAEREKLETRLARMQEFSELWEVFEEKLAARGGYDFDDVISEDEFDALFNNNILAKITHIEVDNNFQSSGIATKLMQLILDLMLKQGYNEFYLNASPMGLSGLSLSHLIEFYEKFEFKVLKHMGNNAIMVKK